MGAMGSSPAIRGVIGGGIGSGKSTISDLYADLGALVVSADTIGHRILEVGGAAYSAVAARWPQVVDRGVVDRRALGSIVFNDDGELAALESISHPIIREEIATRVAEASDRDIVVEVPLTVALVSGRWTRVLVDAPEELRVQRAVARGFEENDVRRRMASQPQRDEWLSWADRVLVNDGTLQELHAKARLLWAHLRGA